MDAEKTIVIICYYYHPQITPRAFRAKELTEEFIRRGWHVILLKPEGVFERNAIIHLHDRLPAPTSPDGTAVRIFFYILLRKLKFLRRLLPGGKDLIGGIQTIYFALRKKKIRADLTISIGLPFSVHLATRLLKAMGVLKSLITVADYGDPFSAMEKRYGGCFYARQIERSTLKSFDFIATPVAAAHDAFEGLVQKSKMITSLQGVRISEYKIGNYKKVPGTVRFAYAGQFYEDIRNPSPFLDELTKTDKKFEFHLYTNPNHKVTDKLLRKYKENLGDRLVIHAPLPRDQCIHELSLYDFLVNVENEIATQVPSKLIDYAIAKRPIFSFRPNNFDGAILNKFLSENYESSLAIDAANYDIEYVADRLLHDIGLGK